MPTGISTSNGTSDASTPPGPSFQSSHTRFIFERCLLTIAPPDARVPNGDGSFFQSPPCRHERIDQRRNNGLRDSVPSLDCG